jgi:hypothetical protein
MAKKNKDDSIIALELERFEKKIKEFQDYLEFTSIKSIGDTKERHSEIDAQIKILNALPNWLASYEKLLEQNDASKELILRGDEEMSGLMKNKLKEK